MKISSRRGFLGSMALVAVCFSLKVKHYLRSKKRNVYTSCLFLAKEFG